MFVSRWFLTGGIPSARDHATNAALEHDPGKWVAVSNKFTLMHGEDAGTRPGWAFAAAVRHSTFSARKALFVVSGIGEFNGISTLLIALSDLVAGAGP
jgi:hypothetical protein